MKKMFMVLFALFLAFIVPTYGHDESKHGEELQLGDVGFQHDKYHEAYKRLWVEVNTGHVGLSDEGYMKEKFGSTYQKLYSSGKCACHSGYCRPTRWRPTQFDSETGYDIEVNRQWVPVPKGALHNETTISPELWRELMSEAEAHVCAYSSGTTPPYISMECAIVPLFGS